MKLANQFTHPMAFYGVYRTNSWAGYVFGETLGYTTGRHTGVDYNGPGAGNADLGMPIVAIANGIIRAVENKSNIGFGWTTIIEHTLSPTLAAQLGVTSIASRYMHQQNIKVSVGQEVAIGQQISEVGNSGTTWAHCHVDLYKNTIDGGLVHWRYDKDTQLASYLDPYTYIDARLSPIDNEPQTLLPYQRVVSNPTGVNHRLAPNTSAGLLKLESNPDGEWAQGEILDFSGYVKGESVNNNNVWFIGRYSGGYLWSGSFEGGANTAGLEDKTDPVVPPIVVPPEPIYTFDKDLDCVTEVIPAAVGNFEVGNFPTSPTKVVLHDFGTDGLDTVGSTINEFKKKGTEKSAHFVVSGKRIVQMVALKDRAYHAGPTGNVYIGIESDPAQDAETIKSVRTLREQLKVKLGFDPEFIKHSTLMNTSCGDDIDLQNYDITPPEVPTEIEKRVTDIEEDMTTVLHFLKSTFKEF